VNLICGRRFLNKKGHRVNVYAHVSILKPDDVKGSKANLEGQAQVLDEKQSSLQMWTKSPRWAENFHLGPITSAKSYLRVACYHRRTMGVLHIESSAEGHDPTQLIGEMILPINTLFVEDDAVSKEGELIGWFSLATPKAEPDELVGSGEVKLGLQLTRSDLLTDRESPVVVEDDEDEDLDDGEEAQMTRRATRREKTVAGIKKTMKAGGVISIGDRGGAHFGDAKDGAESMSSDDEVTAN